MASTGTTKSRSFAKREVGGEEGTGVGSEVHEDGKEGRGREVVPGLVICTVQIFVWLNRY